MRRDFTIQGTFSPALVTQVKECFGDQSVEYGLALAGAPQLVELMSNYNRERFDAHEVVEISAPTLSDKARKLILRADWLVKVDNLRSQLEEHIGPNPRVPDWLKT